VLASLTFRCVESPFRDEVETLRRENERLRAKLAQARVSAPWAAFAVVGVDVAAAMLLRPWLNGESDGRFWCAIAVLGAITLAAGALALGYKRA
jgi:hypothetical protein